MVSNGPSLTPGTAEYCRPKWTGHFVSDGELQAGARSGDDNQDAAARDHRPHADAVVMLLGMLGLRSFEASKAMIEDLGEPAPRSCWDCGVMLPEAADDVLCSDCSSRPWAGR